MTLLPKLKLKAKVLFPKTVIGGTGLEVTQAHGVYDFNLAVDELAPASVIAPAAANSTFVMLWDSATGSYSRINLTGLNSSAEPPGAPVLTWTSGTSDTTPNFTVDLPSGLGAPGDAEIGDIIYLEIADNISFTTTSTDTLDAGDVAGDIVLMAQATPLADGTYYARARLKRGAFFGPYSNVETKTIATAVIALALDGSAKSASLSGTNTVSCTLTTALSNDEIIVFVAYNGADGGAPDNIAVTGASLTFTVRGRTNPGLAPPASVVGNGCVMFYAQAASPLASQVITATIAPGASVAYMEIIAFGVNGIKTSAPFDVNGGLPVVATSGALSLSTSNANDFLFAGFRATGTDAGWTSIQTADFISAQYKIVSATQTATSLGGSNGHNGGIADAIVQGP